MGHRTPYLLTLVEKMAKVVVHGVNTRLSADPEIKYGLAAINPVDLIRICSHRRQAAVVWGEQRTLIPRYRVKRQPEEVQRR